MAIFPTKFLFVFALALIALLQSVQTSWSQATTTASTALDSKLEDPAYLDAMELQLRSDVLEAQRIFFEEARSIEDVTKRYIAAQIKNNMFKALRVLAEKELSIDVKTSKQVPRLPRQETEEVEEETENTTRRGPSMILPQVAQLLKVVFGGNINLTAHVETATSLLPKPVQTQILGVVKLLANNAGYQYITSTSTSTSTVATTSTSPASSTKSSRTKTSTPSDGAAVKAPSASAAVTNPDDEFFPDIGESTSMRTRTRRTSTASTTSSASTASTTKKTSTSTTPSTTTEEDEDTEEEFGGPPGGGNNGFPGFGGQGGEGGFPGDGRIRTGNNRLKPRQFPDILGGLANILGNNRNASRPINLFRSPPTPKPIVITTQRPKSPNKNGENATNNVIQGLGQGLNGALNTVGAGVFAVANGAGAGLGQAINIAGNGVLAVANGAGQGIGQVLHSFGSGINSTINGKPIPAVPGQVQASPMLPGINITMLGQEIRNGVNGAQDLFKGAQEAVKLIESLRDIFSGGSDVIDAIDF